MGLQFENLVLNNFHALARHIGLVGKNVESVAPYFRRGRTSGDGVQIDMHSHPTEVGGGSLTRFVV